MSSIITATAALNNARLTAAQVYADTGSGNSYMELFDNTRVGSIATAPGVTPVVTIVLEDPCGSIVSNKLRLVRADPTGDLIARDSAPAGVSWGRWYNAAGTAMADFDVTDDAGDGFLKITGAGGTVLYAGGRIIAGIVDLD